MFIFYNKVLVENSVNDNVKSQLSTLMFDLKCNCTNTIFSQTQKIESIKPENFKIKSLTALYTVLIDE